MAKSLSKGIKQGEKATDSSRFEPKLCDYFKVDLAMAVCLVQSGGQNVVRTIVYANRA